MSRQARLLRHEALNQLLESPYPALVASVLRETADRSRPPELLRPDERPLRPPLTRLLAWAAQRSRARRVPGARRVVRPAGHARRRWPGSAPLALAGSDAGPRLVTGGGRRGPPSDARAGVPRAPRGPSGGARDAGVVPPATAPTGGLVAHPQQSSYAFAASIARAACAPARPPGGAAAGAVAVRGLLRDPWRADGDVRLADRRLGVRARGHGGEPRGPRRLPGPGEPQSRCCARPRFVTTARACPRPRTCSTATIPRTSAARRR